MKYKTAWNAWEFILYALIDENEKYWRFENTRTAVIFKTRIEARDCQNILTTKNGGKYRIVQLVAIPEKIL